MRVTEALSQIEAIHEQLTKGEVYRGFQVPGLALSGLVGLLAALVQHHFVPTGEPINFVRYWLILAVPCGLLGSGTALYSYCFRENTFARRRTRRVLGQFLPCLLAGVAVTVGLVQSGQVHIPLLPGLWALLFGLGILATRPYLPRTIGWVALFYLVCGAALLSQASSLAPAGWQVGGVFGLGQLATALVFSRNLERTEHD